MNYKYCEKQNFEDYACGRVIYHQSGMTNFPVRLAQEIFKRCLSYLDLQENISIYDPCCGGGYLLTVLGLLNRNIITDFHGSDINTSAVDLTKNNLSLLNEIGLKKRIIQLEQLYKQFHKQSHLDAIESAKRILNGHKKYLIKPNTTVFQADSLSKQSLNRKSFKTDIVITDVPYGDLVSWQGGDDNAMNTLLENLIPLIKPTSIIAVISNKKQKISNDKFIRLEKQVIGKRKFEILKCKEGIG